MSKASRNVSIALATGFGSGFLPLAPGSWGAAVAAVGAWWLLDLSVVWYAIATVVIFFVGITVVNTVDDYFHSRGGAQSDNGKIVIDEWVGMLVTLLPLFYFEKSWLYVGIGYFLFRLFDALKFGLAKIADRAHGRWGVMLDDVFAGMHAAVFFTIVLLIVERL